MNIKEFIEVNIDVTYTMTRNIILNKLIFQAEMFSLAPVLVVLRDKTGVLGPGLGLDGMFMVVRSCVILYFS